MSVKLFRVILPVNDIVAAARFYSIVLDQDGIRVSDGRHYFDCGGTILACFDARADGDDVETRPNPEWLYFAVDDIGGTYQACLRAGAAMSDDDIHGTVAGEIHARPWGERSFYCIDPFGNKLCFVDRGTMFTGA